jgi:hypothetical protein
MAHSVRRWLGVWGGAAAALDGCQEAGKLAASCVEGALFGLGFSVGEQRAALVVDEIANDLLDGLFAEVAVHLHAADNLATQNPQVVTMAAQGRARQIQGQ